MNIIFAGTPDFAAVALQALLEAGHTVPLVLTQPDRPAGRGMQLHPSAVKQLAEANGVTVAQPVSLRLDGKSPEIAAAAHRLLRATPHDVMVVAAYGLILPPSVLEIAPLGCINIHASLLPRWRGAAPIHRAIEAGDTETGVTIMQMDAGLDTGAILLREGVPIAAADTTGTLHDRLAILGSRMAVQAIAGLEEGTVFATPQPDTGVTYAHKISKEEVALDFSDDAVILERRIRAFDPFPGAHARFNGASIKLWRAEALPSSPHHRPGEIIAADAATGVVAACGQGALRLSQLQRPGGRRLDAAAFLQGFPMEGGAFG